MVSSAHHKDRVFSFLLHNHLDLSINAFINSPWVNFSPLIIYEILNSLHFATDDVERVNRCGNVDGSGGEK